MDTALPEIAPGAPAWTRRRFLAGGVAGMIGGRLAVAGLLDRRQPLTIGLVAEGDSPIGREVAAGVELGVAEAARAGDLLGESIRLVRSEAHDALAAGRSLLRAPAPHALLGARDEGEAAALARLAAGAGSLYLNLTYDPATLAGAEALPTTFHLWPTFEDRVAAVLSAAVPRGLRRWLLVAPAGSGRDLLERIAVARPGAEVRLADLLEGAVDVRRTWPDVDGVLLALRGAERGRYLSGTPLPALPVGDVSGEEPLRPPRSGLPRYHVAAWNPEGEAYGAGELNERFRRRNDAPMGSAAWTAWLAIKALWEAWLRAPRDSAPELGEMLAAGRGFDGHKGVPLSFGPERRLRQPLYVIETTGGRSAVVGEWSPADSGEPR